MNKYLKSGIVLLLFFLYPFFAVLPFILFKGNVNVLPMNLKIIYFISVNVIFLCTLLIIYHKDITNYYYDFRKNGKKYISKYIKYWYLGIFIMIVSNYLINTYTPNEIAENERMIREMLQTTPIYVLFSTIIYAPIVEEIICRKTLKDIINSKWLFIITSALIFGCAHLLNSFDSSWNLLYIIPYGTLGSIFAFCYYETKNLFTSIFLHTLHNGILISLYLLIL